MKEKGTKCPNGSNMEGRSPDCMGVSRQKFQKEMDYWDAEKTKLPGEIEMILEESHENRGLRTPLYYR